MVKKKRIYNNLDGILLVNKPQGWTSHDVVAKIRNHFSIKKVGHGGTLDPMATGVLVILLGKKTKISSEITNGDKSYSGKILLGKKTTTQDIQGKIIEENNPKKITIHDLKKVIKSSFNGKIKQIPPMVSAIKKNGVPLYKLARKGMDIERDSRIINVYNFKIIDFHNPVIEFFIKCSKGTYIRTIANDLGQKLKCGACLSSLCREGSGKYDLKNSYELDTILSHDFISIQKILIRD